MAGNKAKNQNLSSDFKTEVFRKTKTEVYYSVPQNQE